MQILVVVGLLLTLAVGVLYVRSFWVWDAIRVHRAWADGDWRTMTGGFVAINCGQVRLHLEDWRRTYAQAQLINGGFRATGVSVHRDLGDPDPSYVRRADGDSPPWERLGFFYQTEASVLTQTPGRTWREFSAPAWFVLLVCGGMTAAPYAYLRRDNRRRARLAQGRCARCGYDRRVTPDRCPECGEMPEGSPAAAA